jgi:hypothetical protein
MLGTDAVIMHRQTSLVMCTVHMYHSMRSSQWDVQGTAP